jgi:fructokinase
MKNNPIIVGLGELLWDMLPSGKQLGGAPANFAYHAAGLGAQARVVSAVGTDLLGDEIMARIAQLGLPADWLQRDGAHPTGTVDVELDAAGQPTYTIHEHVAWDFIRWTSPLADLASRCDAVCFGSLCQRNAVSRNTIKEFLAHTRPKCARIFDINLRQQFYSREVIEESLRACSVLKLNDEELPVLADVLGIRGSTEALITSLIINFDLKLCALTRGARGSFLVAPEGAHDHPGIPTEVADTVGSGDAFAAAVAMGLLRGAKLKEINLHANTIAARVCAAHGATPDIDWSP